MIMTIEEAKYAMHDLTYDDNATYDAIHSAENAIESYLRYSLDTFEGDIPSVLKTAAKFYVTCLHDMLLPDVWEESFHRLIRPYRDMPV